MAREPEPEDGLDPPGEPHEELGWGGEAADAEDDHAATTSARDPGAPRGPSLSLGASLLVLGLAVWGLYAVIRVTGGPPAAPAAAIGVGPGQQPAPSEAAGERPETPAAERSATPAATEPEAAAGEGAAPSPVAAADEASDADEAAPPAIPEEEPVLEPPPLDGSWVKAIAPPSEVRYTVRRGGSMKMVANLYKVFHHEIQALNPGVDLDRELAPGTSVVVYRKPEGQRSRSIGTPSSGKLEGAVPMVEGPGRVLKMIPWKSWATDYTVATMDGLLKEWARRFPEADPILVGNMSARGGGRLEPHSTHQSGRDVDLGYPQKRRKTEELNWREMTADNLDADRTWALLELLRGSGEVEVVLIDTAIQRLLYDYALKTRRYTKGQLASWLEAPRPVGSTGAFVQHHPGHVDHLHVRIRCRSGDAGCGSRRD